MRQDLDTLKSEILEHLKAQDFVVFHGISRQTDAQPAVYWDTIRHPDFRMFLGTARQAGVKLVTFYHRDFLRDTLDDAFDRLEECELPAEERDNLERRLRDMQAYEGFTCAIELSFDHQGRAYVYDLHTDWYLEFLDVVDEIDSYIPEEGEDEGPIGGYFSKN
jgi:hypothetical protein